MLNARSARLAALALALGAVLAAVAGRATVARAEQTSPPVATYRGSEKQVFGPFDLSAGVTVVRARSNGTANFVVYLVMPEPGKKVEDSYGDRYLMIDAIGRYDGAAADIIKKSGGYYVEVSQASGQYEINVEQPMPANVTGVVDDHQFSGKGQQVTKVFRLAQGSYTVNAQNDNTALRVRLYQLDDLGGGAVISSLTGYYGDRLMDTTIPPGYTSVPIDIADDGLFILYVDAEGTGSGNWSVSVD